MKKILSLAWLIWYPKKADQQPTDWKEFYRLVLKNLFAVFCQRGWKAIFYVFQTTNFNVFHNIRRSLSENLKILYFRQKFKVG